MLIVISTTFNTLASRIERCQYEAVNSPSTLTTQCCASLSGDTLDDAEANDLAEMLKALADPVRLRLVSLMANSDTGEVCACDLPDLLQRSQPTVSHHLGILTRAGIVDREQRGKWAWFSIRHDRLRQLSSAISPPTDVAVDSATAE